MLLKNSCLRLLLAITACGLAAGFALADVTAPARIGDLGVDKAGADVSLAWSVVVLDAAGNDETVASYNIYRGTTPGFVADKAGGTNRVGNSVAASFVDVGALSAGDDFYYRVTAVDTAGNEGGSMVPLVMTPPVLSGSWTETTIDVDWTDAQPMGNVASYRVYYGQAPGQYDFVEDVGLANAHTLMGLDLWVNWYIAVTAVDNNGNESAFSNEHADAVAGRVRVTAHDDSELCWGADKCTPPAGQEQRANGWQLNVPADFPAGDWTRVTLKFTMASKLCDPPAGGNTTRCGSGNPCVNPPCNGGYNTCGDPWDRGAHVWLVLDEDCITNGTNCKTNTALELMNAVTSFGTDAPTPDGRGITPPRELTLDITPYAPILNGTLYVGAEIGHYVQTGHWVTVEFEFSKRADEASPKPPADGIQVLFYGNQSPPTATLSVPAEAQQVFTRLFTTGHGGNQACDGGSADGQSCDTGCPGGSCQNCDEFCHRTNSILADGSPIWSAIPWRGDCSPGGITDCQNWNSCGWPSCTYSRAGWCPGYVACHHDAPCDQDLDMTLDLAPGATYDVDYNVTPLNGSWSVSLVAYWYNDSIAFCGNNLRQADEICDGTDLDGESCQTQGFDVGTLACAGDCTGFDTTGCRTVVCGDNVCDSAGGEDCLTCDLDCNGVQSGKPADQYCCGAGGGTNPVSCTDPRCTADGNTCE
ncbi:MAG: hypothetical protein IFK94_02225 [Acidobacteria bacterium]|uniref:Peptide-N-glycosidase F C-terminal domain-containing protein n=1 Tax=Candidatus Polarisedimenticola svalbardensis TaxID=2886004 RepID=A0A8J7CDK2_9BACT|nr:hypothetical protein [Candidatus Polarisedimenticola svalbardensis]